MKREPLFNIPPVVVALLAVLALIHAVRTLALSDERDIEFLLTFAFIPARYDASVLDGVLPGGFGAELWTFVTYALIHADWNIAQAARLANVDRVHFIRMMRKHGMRRP